MGSGSQRFGERLVAAGVIERKVLEEAREIQAVQGGRIGTCLVEIGALKLDQLAKYLGKHHGIPASLDQHFQRAEPSIQARLNAKLAAELSVVPLAKVVGEPIIACAAMDPLNADDTGELANALDSGVVIAVAPELRILYHLERAYGIERPNRFKRPLSQGPAPLPHQIKSDTGKERRVPVKTLSETAAVEVPSTLAKIAVRRVHMAPTGETDLQIDVSNLETALTSIRRVNSRPGVGALVVGALHQGFDQSISAGMLLTIRGGALLGWKGFVRGGDSRVVEGIAVALNDLSAFLEPCSTQASYFGRPPDSPSPIDRRLWESLGSAPPAEIGVHPVTVFGRLACAIYVQSTSELSASVAGGVAELGQGLAAALERLVRADQR